MLPGKVCRNVILADLYLQDEMQVAFYPTLSRAWCCKGRRGQRLVKAPGDNRLWRVSRRVVTHNHHRSTFELLLADLEKHFQTLAQTPAEVFRHIGSPFATDKDHDAPLSRSGRIIILEAYSLKTASYVALTLFCDVAF